MFTISKITSNNVVDYAAEELKKYLRMMMPEGGDVVIAYAPDAKDGFRLGLMQDFGLDVSDAEDVELDDILYINTDEKGGIIAGDNPRSVLLAVYEYLRQNGCRWLFPGVDGEFIPMQNIKPVTYRFKPSCRYRGQCNEGAEYQSDMLDAIEFTPKVGLNIFMLEFRIPTCYYSSYYNHPHNETNRPPEPVTDETVLQWKRQCEAEIAKRGLQFHDIGHGWTTDAFGIDSALQTWNAETAAALPDEKRKYLALVKGERKLIGNHPYYTNFCMSLPEYRQMFVDAVVDYAENHSNIDYLHLWLGDSKNKQCECETCQAKSATDWYLVLMNEVDEALTARGLHTRIVFISYMDTVWAPETVELKNPDRFTLLLAPVTRSYLETLPKEPTKVEVKPYVKNQVVLPANLEETFAYFDEWKKHWKGANLAYEYHFWYHQYNDLGGLEISKVINEDVKVYKENAVNGIIEDGSQRSYFPTGLAFYTYARTLFDTSLSYEEIEEEYFSCAFGKDWEKFRDYLGNLGNAFGYRYLERAHFSKKENRSPYYNPDHLASLESADDILEDGVALIREHYNSPYRICTVSVRILEKHAKYAKLLLDALKPKCQGFDDEADKLFDELKLEFGKEELAIERWYDHSLAMNSLNRIFSTRTKDAEVTTDMWQALQKKDDKKSNQKT